ncbi:hypothetical protein [Calycomorphotria hydatis]|uniref:Phage integrase family protein n=1 Tax=Calycomorphotria hydatis TaxID=2528027 RepID=A0A517T8S1_9PLAN|nr:hypothetical protein [Calycomorphotria hydatis]QDT64782.1 hypothetical protein V22_20230 [Calycomorphotria hydatis]
MATRQRRGWKAGPDGKFTRQIGWKWNSSGKQVQHKFRLGTNQREAQRREARLRHLWDTIERRVTAFDFDGAMWNELTLGWAKQIANGTFPPRVQIEPDETPREYASRLLQLRYAFAGFPLDPHDIATFEIGLKHMTADPREVTLGLRKPNDTAYLPPTTCPTTCEPNYVQTMPFYFGATEQDLVRENANGQFRNKPIQTGDMFHTALREFQEHLRVEFRRPVSENGTNISDWGHTQLKQVDVLVAHHPNRELSTLTLDGLDELFGYWRRRPLKLGTEQPVQKATSGNQIDILKKFFKWLHRNADYDWKRPEGYEEISHKVATLQGDHVAGLHQVDTFRVEELAALFKCGTPIERALLLLALNCGFGAREIATLRWDEVHLFKAHEPQFQELLGIGTTDSDSFIKRSRGKTGVYGEWMLFDMTVQAIQWLRRRYDDFPSNVEPLVMLNDRGKPHYRRTQNGNVNSQIVARFNAMKSRANKHKCSVPNHSFGKLRKTAGNLVRQLGDGEVAGVFLAHSQSVRQDDLSDVYTNRPFGRLFEVLQKVEEHLKPIFVAGGNNPFELQNQDLVTPYASLHTIKDKQ